MILDSILVQDYLRLYMLFLNSLSVEKYPDNRMLGEREIIDGKVLLVLFIFWFLWLFISQNLILSSGLCLYVQAGKYVWLTYKEVYDTVLKVGDSICSRGINKVREY